MTEALESRLAIIEARLTAIEAQVQALHDMIRQLNEAAAKHRNEGVSGGGGKGIAA